MVTCACVLVSGWALDPAATWAADGPPRRVVVLVGQSMEPGRALLDAFERHLEHSGILVDLDVAVVDADPTAAGAAIDHIRATKPALVLTFGSEAAQMLIASGADVPHLAGLVGNERELAGGVHTTGLLMRFPMATQLEWLRRVIPGCRSVGMVYHGGRGAGAVARMRDAASKVGIRIEDRPIGDAKEIPAALRSLTNTACAVIGLPDPMVLTRHTAKAILLFSFRHRIPFVGPSEPWVKAGALYALSWHDVDIGAHLASLASRVLSGEPPGTIHAIPARHVRVIVNQRTARHMKLTIPTSVLEEADRVY